jgi:hypothetical protein
LGEVLKCCYTTQSLCPRKGTSDSEQAKIVAGTRQAKLQVRKN